MSLVEVATTRALVAVKPSGNRPPFFCVHGAGGNVLNFRDLSRGMNRAQPFYGLQARGVDGLGRPHGSITEMALDYAAAVRRQQPRGPYLLGGYSAGGVVAFEMARVLSAAGERVALLALIDTMHPRTPVERTTLRGRLARFRREGLSYLVEAVRKRTQSFTQRKMRRAIARHLRRGERVPFELRELYLIDNYRRAVAAYPWEPWSGRGTLFRAADVDPAARRAGSAYGWDRYLRGGVEVVAIPGNHRTLLLGGNAAPLALALDAAIERALGPE